jgi:hypothetical protein
MFGIPVVDTIVCLTAFVSFALTAFLAYALRHQFSFATLCVMGLGVAPLIIYLAIFIPFHIRGASPITALPFWIGFPDMALYIAPNYLISFVISAAFLITSGIRKSTERATSVICAILVLVHGIGLSWAYLLLTHRGSF